MDESTYDCCRQRGCIRFGLWHTSRDNGHRFRTLHTALAVVTVEKQAEGDAWAVWVAPHGEERRQVSAAPDPTPSTSHEDHMELRAAVLYALRSAEKFNAA
jgi:hypothetical protein